MKVSIGNIPPNKKITIKFAYLEPLSECLNKFWKFELPSTLTPRYDNFHDNLPKNMEDNEKICGGIP